MRNPAPRARSISHRQRHQRAGWRSQATQTGGSAVSEGGPEGRETREQGERVGPLNCRKSYPSRQGAVNVKCGAAEEIRSAKVLRLQPRPETRAAGSRQGTRRDIESRSDRDSKKSGDPFPTPGNRKSA